MTGQLWLLDLAAAARSSGLRVVEVPGWRGRGRCGFKSIELLTCHHTGGPHPSLAGRYGDYPSLGTILRGKNLDGPIAKRVPGPLAQLGLGYSGTVYVIAAGVANHPGVVRRSWMNKHHSIGIEAEHDGVSPWPPHLYSAYVRLAAAVARWYDVPVLGHKETCWPPGRKIDPNFHMDTFRAHVARVHHPPRWPEGDDMPTPQQVVHALMQHRLHVRHPVTGQPETIAVEELFRRLHEGYLIERSTARNVVTVSRNVVSVAQNVASLTRVVVATRRQQLRDRRLASPPPPPVQPPPPESAGVPLGPDGGGTAEGDV